MFTCVATIYRLLGLVNQYVGFAIKHKEIYTTGKSWPKRVTFVLAVPIE